MKVYYYGDKISERIAKTPEGFLICQDVPISRIGYQEYLASELTDSPLREDKIIPVYRPKEEVFDIRSLASFEGKPVTNEHPEEDVTPENYQKYSCGHVQNVHIGEGEDANKVLADLYITDPILIRLIQNGKREISCGYYAEEKRDPSGKICQTRIRGNHVAIVDRGRAGKKVCIRDQKPYLRRSSEMKRRSIYGRSRGLRYLDDDVLLDDDILVGDEDVLTDEDILTDEDVLVGDADLYDDDILADEDVLVGDADLYDEDILVGDEDVLMDEDILTDEDVLVGDEDVLVGDEDVLVGDEDVLVGDEDITVDVDEVLQDAKRTLRDAKRTLRSIQLRDSANKMRRNRNRLRRLRDAIILNDEDICDEDVLTDEDILADEDILVGDEDVLTDEDILADEDILTDEDVLTDEDILTDEDVLVGDEDILTDEDICDEDILVGDEEVCDEDICDDDLLVGDEEAVLQDEDYCDDDIEVVDTDDLVNQRDGEESIDTKNAKALRDITEASRSITDPVQRKKLQDAIYKALCGRTQMDGVMKITKNNGRARLDSLRGATGSINMDKQQAIYDSFNPHKQTKF